MNIFDFDVGIVGQKFTVFVRASFTPLLKSSFFTRMALFIQTNCTTIIPNMEMPIKTISPVIFFLFMPQI